MSQVGSPHQRVSGGPAAVDDDERGHHELGEDDEQRGQGDRAAAQTDQRDQRDHDERGDEPDLLLEQRAERQRGEERGQARRPR